MSRPRKHANATARAQSSRAAMQAKNWRPVQVWLSPEQVAKLGADKSATVRNWLDSIDGQGTIKPPQKQE